MSNSSLTPARAARHGALHGRIEGLLKQLEPVARTKPGQEVSAPVRSLAEDLLFEARLFRRSGEPRGLVAAAPDHAGLHVQLGQALMTLQAWEDRHAAWHPQKACRVWCFGDGTFEPVMRYKPELKPHTDRAPADIAHMRRKIERHIAHREQAIFEAGRRAATDGSSFDEAVAGLYPPRVTLRTWAVRGRSGQAAEEEA